MNAEPPEQFLQLWSKYSRRLFLYISALLPNPADADEVFQETQIVIWQKFGDFSPGTNFLAWAYRIAQLQVKQYCRRVNRHPVTFSSEILEQLSERLSADEPWLERQRAALAKCKQQLSESDRTLIELCYAPGARVDEVAKALRRKRTSVYRSLRRIRKLLQKCIERTTQADE